MKPRHIRRLETALAILGVNCFSASLLIGVLTPPASGYELSIINAFPPFFWLLPLLGTACGSSILILEAFAPVQTKRWIGGVAIVAASNTVLLISPLLHGYASYPSGDALTHLGYIKDIISTGRVGPSNFYPIVHILGATVELLALPGSLALPVVLYTSWYFVYISSMFLLAKIVTANRRDRLLVIAFASPLIFSNMHTVIHPSMLALFLMPLLLYAYHRRQVVKSRRVETTVVLLLTAFAITFTHPITAIFAILVMTSLIFSNTTLFQILGKRYIELKPAPGTSTSYRLPLIMSVTFFTWYVSYAAITRSVEKVFEWLVSANANSAFEQQTSLLSLSGLTALQTAQLFLFRYGEIAFNFGLSLGATVLIAIGFRKSRGKSGMIRIGYALAFVLALLVSSYSLLGFTGEFDPTRIARFFLLIAPIVCALGFGETQREAKKERMGTLAPHNLKGRQRTVAAIVFLFVALSVTGLLSSPPTASGNWQVSRQAVSGGQWFD